MAEGGEGINVIRVWYHVGGMGAEVLVSDLGRGQMNRLPDQGPRAPKGAQELLVRWAVHRTNYRG